MKMDIRKLSEWISHSHPIELVAVVPLTVSVNETLAESSSSAIYHWNYFYYVLAFSWAVVLTVVTMICIYKYCGHRFKITNHHKDILDRAPEMDKEAMLSDEQVLSMMRMDDPR